MASSLEVEKNKSLGRRTNRNTLTSVFFFSPTLPSSVTLSLFLLSLSLFLREEIFQRILSSWPSMTSRTTSWPK